MRSFAWLALIAFVTLAPSALAQSTTITMRPPSDPIVPLGPAVQLPITVETDCPPEAAAQGVSVSYVVSRQPAWAQVTISPSSDHKDYASCAGGRATFRAIASVTATHDAPAFSPESLEVTVRTMGSALGGSASGRTNVPITAAFFSIIDAQAALTQRAVSPREIVTFPITFTNLGNGNTKITFDASERDEGVYPAVPPPLYLQSKQSGAAENAQVVNLQAYRLSTATGITQFTLRYQAAYALDGALKGDEGAITFRLAPRSGASEETPTDAAPEEAPSPLANFVPGPSLPIALVPLGVAALVFRGRNATE